MSGSDDRPRGMLTPNDRDLLRGEVEYEHKQQYSDRRRDVRERIANGILDFSIIQYLLRDRDRKRIFQNVADAADVEEAHLHESIHAMLYWTYFGLKEQNYDFEGLISEAIEQAEVDFAQKYRRQSVDVSVEFDIAVRRAHDIDDLISVVEQGGPVQANRLYDLLELSGGVPIDTSKLDTVRVWFQSSYPEGEKAVLEALFSDYLGVEVDVKDAEARVILEDIEQESAVVDSERSTPDASEIKNHRHSTEYGIDQETIDEIRKGRILNQDTGGREQISDESESILNAAIEDINETSESPPPTIHDMVKGERDVADWDEEITPETVLKLLQRVRNPFVSTVEVATVYGCTPDAARQVLSALYEEGQINRHSVVDNSGSRLSIWYINEDTC